MRKWPNLFIIFPVITILLYTCSCAGTLDVRRRTWASEQDRVGFSATVQILSLCTADAGMSGSGVVIAPRRVLTARHVVNCAADKMPFAAPPIITIKWGGKTLLAEVEAYTSEKDDSARLVLVDSEEHFTTVARPGPAPALGETICLYGFDGVDIFAPTCGKVTERGLNYLKISLHVVRGNSGGGLLNSQGQLVGIASRGRDHADTSFVCWAMSRAAWGGFLS